MTTRGGTKFDLLETISGLQAKVAELTDENRQLRAALPDSGETKKLSAVTWSRADVEEVIAEAEKLARRTNRTRYVGAICWPDGSQIYGDGTLGITDDKAMLEGLGTIFATCEPDKTTRHK